MRYRPRERTLEIAFRDGRGVYRYFDVPEREWQAFRSAPSKGTYLNQAFKSHGYGYEKLPLHGDVSVPSSSSPPNGDESFWGEPLGGTAPSRH